MVTTIQIWRQTDQLYILIKNETLLQVDDEVGQLAHQDDLQMIRISPKLRVCVYKRKGKICPAEESFFYLEHEPGRVFTHIICGSVDAHLDQGQLEPNQIMYAGLLTGQFLHILGYENGQ